jgi:hypothetical protein
MRDSIPTIPKINLPAIASLTAEQLRSLLHYDPDTGTWRWRPRPVSARTERRRKARGSTPRYEGQVAGYINGQGYRYISIYRKFHKASRLAFLYVTGVLPVATVDHINHDRGDDRWSNLRSVTPSESAMNRGPRADSVSRYRGVSRDARAGKWRVEIRRSTQPIIYLGSYDDPRSAALVYDMAARCLHGAHARLNFPAEESDYVLLPDRALARINIALFGQRAIVFYRRLASRI